MDKTPTLAHLELFLNDEAATQALAEQLADAIRHPDTTPVSARLHLQGDLGAGKTTFARALLRACGVTGRIKSPSYALLETYKVSNLYLYHFDFYRFSSADDWEDAGFREILQKQAIILIEWPDQAGTQLPPPDVELTLIHADHGRQARLAAYSEKGRTWLTTLTPPQAGSHSPDGGACSPPPPC